jgi:predicted ATP-grasp superfamily ATP-dependent carboligase
LGPQILITDGTERAALAGARALVAAGYVVHVAAARPWSLAGVSRHVQRCLLTTDPFADPPGYAAEVGRIVADRGIGVVLPMTDASVEALLEHRHLLPPTVALPLADLATYRRASDKGQLLELARAAGFTVPETVVLECHDKDATWPDELFPAVVKPHRSVVTVNGKRRALAVSFVRNADECRQALAHLPPGRFRSAATTRGGGRRRAVRAPMGRPHGRAVRAPPSAREAAGGGVSVYRESIPLDPELVRAGNGCSTRSTGKGSR